MLPNNSVYASKEPNLDINQKSFDKSLDALKENIYKIPSQKTSKEICQVKSPSIQLGVNNENIKN